MHSDGAETVDTGLGIIDRMTVNACALGRRTIAVTKGAMSTFSEEELKAVLSHELVHIINRDTVAALYALVGSGIFSVVFLPIRLIFAALESAKQRWAEIIGAMFGAIFAGFLVLVQMAMSVNNRKSEQRADVFTVQLGYGENMVSALYLLEKISLGGQGSLIQRLLAKHPRVTSRIERLEVALGIQEAE